MRRIYSIVTTLLLFLTVSTGCEDDYRDMVLFEGVEPIYQLGTCDNLVSSLTLYLTNPDGVVLGIDGGDGDYSVSSDNASMVAVTFAEDVNGYRRIKILPKAQGVTTILVKDHSGASTMLKIIVEDCYKFYIHVRQTAYGHTGELSESLWSQIQEELAVALMVQKGGTYTLIPADKDDPWYGGGELRVHPSALVEAFVEGTYEPLESEGTLAYRFRYNNEVHEFTHKAPAITRDSPIAPVYMFEDVTPFVSAALPAGCKVYRQEKWEVSSRPVSDYN